MGTNNENTAGKMPESLPEPLKSKESLIEPFDWYAKQRRSGAIHYDGQRSVYDVFGYQEVGTILQDGNRFLRPSLDGAHERSDPESPLAYLDNAMMWSDGQAHADVKGDLFEYFRPDRMVEMRNTIRSVADSQIESALDGGTEFDFAQDFAEPVSLKIAMELVGVPETDYTRMHAWLDEIAAIKRSEFSKRENKTPGHSTKAVEYMQNLVQTKKENPADDLLSVIANNTELNETEVGSNCLDLMMASLKTMSDFLTNTLYLIVNHDLVTELQNYEISEFLEEVLRYRSPIQSHVRKTSESVRVAGTDIPEGSDVVLWLGAANRDPKEYDQPAEFRPRREPEHLAFGSGPHACIAAPLARFEAPIILNSFITRFEEISTSGELLEPTSAASSLGFKRFPVSTTPVRDE